MESKTRIFIDFWNFSLNWRHVLSPDQKIDWRKLPIELISAAQTTISGTGSQEKLELAETRVYASTDVNTAPGRKFKNWLDTFLDRQPGTRVFSRERKAKKKPIRCNSCSHEQNNCPKCNAEYSRSIEKGVDSAIVTDLFSLAWENGYKVAILVSSDADFVPAVDRLQDKDYKVINATWRSQGHKLANVCWGSFYLNDITTRIERVEVD